MRQSFEAYRLGRGSTSLLGLLSWRGILALAIGATLVTAVFLATAGLFLLLLPVAVLAAVIGRLLYGARRPVAPQRPAPKRAAVIEGDFEVIGEQPTQPSGRGRPGDRRPWT